jgi:hypothetical protein
VAEFRAHKGAVKIHADFHVEPGVDSAPTEQKAAGQVYPGVKADVPNKRLEAIAHRTGNISLRTLPTGVGALSVV